jgi:DNA-binding response OmpR family regulator
MSELRGKTVLVVEDEFLIACTIAETLKEAGAAVVGPANTLEVGLRLASEVSLDAAILDVNLRGVRSDAIAEQLSRRSIPFILATGYGEASTPPGAVVLGKPFAPARLVQVLRSLLATGTSATG